MENEQSYSDKLKEIHIQIQHKMDLFEFQYYTQPNQIILGREIYNFLKASCDYLKIENNIEERPEYCGIPVCVDYKDKNRISVGHVI